MKRILLIDDESEILSLVSSELAENFDVSIECATSGLEAIEILARGERFDLIICDYTMPKGDGQVVFRYLQRSGNATPFILYTSWLDLPVFEGENFLGVVAKDDLQNLVKLAREALEGPPRRELVSRLDRMDIH